LLFYFTKFLQSSLGTLKLSFFDPTSGSEAKLFVANPQAELGFETVSVGNSHTFPAVHLPGTKHAERLYRCTALSNQRHAFMHSVNTASGSQPRRLIRMPDLSTKRLH
jgi:hypothetical protein